ncbi:MAG: hypothetical protein Q9163_002986 [Psora crenata]
MPMQYLLEKLIFELPEHATSGFSRSSTISKPLLYPRALQYFWDSGSAPPGGAQNKEYRAKWCDIARLLAYDLVVLLETGSTPLIRNTAAQQLGDVQKQHPDELFNLLARVVPYLRHKSWDVRTAAAKALSCIVENTSPFEPNGDEGDCTADGHEREHGDVNNAPLSTPQHEDRLQLDTLDISSILSYGTKLLASGGQEVDLLIASQDPVTQLEFKRKTAFCRMGLRGGNVAEQISKVVEAMNIKPRSTDTGNGVITLPRVDTSASIIAEEDELQSPMTSSAFSPLPVSAQTPTSQTGLSKRQLNQLKRKQKLDARSQANKVRVVDLASRRPSINSPATASPSEPFAIKSDIKSEMEDDEKDDIFSLKRSNIDEGAKIVSDFKGSKDIAPEKSIIQTESEESGHEWPFERLCEVMVADLFDSSWDIRHGAAMGLREVIRVHGGAAGRESGRTKAQNNALNAEWADDIACRLCSVLMLDRFGDYISDNVVAPIRETIGQTLGALMVHLSPGKVKLVYKVLHRMVMQQDLKISNRIWEVCHGGMIGLRYLVAVRSDLLVADDNLLDGVVEAVMRGLADCDDDVRAVSAATLIPIAREFVTLRPTALDNLINIVWGCLSDLRDDLSASTGFVMDLLAKLCSFPEVLDAMKQNAVRDEEQSFANLVPRLYPFLRHTITSVRLAVLRALQTFLHVGRDEIRGWVNCRIIRLVYQNLLVERNDQNLALSLEVFKSLLEIIVSNGAFEGEFSEHAEDVLALALHPLGTSRNSLPIPRFRMIKPSGQLYGPPNPDCQKSNGEPPAKRRKRLEKRDEGHSIPSHNVDGPMISGDVDLVGMGTLIRSRIFAAKAVGDILARHAAGDGRNVLVRGLSEGLRSAYSTTQITASLAIEECAKVSGENDDVPSKFSGDLLGVLDAERPQNYSDILPYLRIVRSQCQNLLNAFREHGHVPLAKLPTVAIVVQGDVGAGPSAFSIANAQSLVSTDFDRLKKSLSPANRITSSKILADAQGATIEAIAEATKIKAERDMRIKAAAAGALVAIGVVPKKPSALIKSIMDSIKAEEDIDLQKRSAAAIAALLNYYATVHKRGPADKIIGNLTSFYCMDTSETPEYSVNAAKQDVILSLHKEEDRKDYATTHDYEKEARAARVTRRGTKEALDHLCKTFSIDLFIKAPVLRSKIEGPLTQAFGGDVSMDVDGDTKKDLCQEVIDGISILRALIPAMHTELRPFIIDLMPLLAKALRSTLAVFRYAAAKCLATVCSVLRIEGMSMLVEHILPQCSSDDLHCRQGAIELIYHLIHVMEDNILPYVIFLIVPVLGRMSDSDNDIRLIATTTFATLVKLVPLEAGIPDPPGLPKNLLEGRDRERKFISQMLDFKKVEPFELPVAIKAELRSYQQEGVNWLAFLNRYHLHGILCDDMGLGKTLQTICIVASDHHLRAEEYAKTRAAESRRLPSLIVCPPTLSGHWQQEILQFAPFLSCLAFVGHAQDRARLVGQLGKTDIVITSYDACRREIDILAPLKWNYCVLDEGHLIKNPKAKISMAVKRLMSNHRLILSGTPIQNNVLELWSLFDFLMPGFLGSEKVFLDRFAKPIAASRYAKSSSKEQEAGALAIEALHKQILPFLLRRLKEEVLDDLPPKILQNYYCDLSDLQKKLFEDFARTERKTITEEAGSETKEAKQHIFQALQYMRKLCNSPALVVKEDHKQYSAIQSSLARQNSSLRDPAHAPKLTALRDLLIDCGIGTDPSDSNTFVSPHRALIFCQMKEMLDIVATTVLRDLLPNVQYLRLDGSVEANKRQSIVNQFNTDPSYDCLLLTTSVGGLGLNLTGADTVIFVEHDWNPQKDMQAMDRAHRIGQKKVVNVYRLVTRGTLEEKILKRRSLQRFKIDVASTVVNQQNAGLATMETDQILDLFDISTSDPSSAAALPPPPSNTMDIDTARGKEEDLLDATTGQVKEKGKRGYLDDLGELWDEKAYEEEFDLGGFLKTMKINAYPSSEVFAYHRWAHFGKLMPPGFGTWSINPDQLGPQSRKNVTPTTNKLSSLLERDESPEESRPNIDALVSSPNVPTSASNGTRVGISSSALRTPQTASRVMPAREELHPSKVHQSTTKPPAICGPHGSHPDNALPRSPSKIAIAVGTYHTPTKTKPFAPRDMTSPTFDFSFERPESDLSAEAQKIMDSVREEAAKIKAQMIAERSKQEYQDGEADRLFGIGERPIRNAKGKSGRFSDVHRQEFRKMESISNHASTWKHKLQGAASSPLKRSSSKAGLDETPKSLPRPKSYKNFYSSALERLENTAPGKRVKRAQEDDDFRVRPSSRDTTSGCESTQMSPSKIYPTSALPSAVTTPPKASIARSTSVKSLKISMIPSLSRSASTKTLNSSAAPRTEGSNKRQGSWSKFGGSMKSILHRSQPKFSNDPSRVAAGTHLPLSHQTADVNKDLPSVPGSPTVKRVNFTPTTKPRHELVVVPDPPSPSKVHTSNTNRLATRDMSSSAAATPIDDLLTYPDLGASPNVTTRHKSPQPSYAPSSYPSDFTFRSDKKMASNPTGFASPDGTTTIRQVRPSGIPTSVADPFVGKLPSIPHGRSNKKRKHVSSDEDEEIENVNPQVMDVDGREGSGIDGQPSTKKPRLTGCSSPTKVVAGQDSPSKRRMTGTGAGGGRVAKKGGLSLSRLNMLARPKTRR